MKYTQFLVFEVGRECNLACQHQRCPSDTPDRYGELDTSSVLADDTIADCAEIAYKELGFRGNVAWHYYNEPMLSWDRIVGLMNTIAAKTKRAKFTLWTNGTKLSPDTPYLELLDQIWVTNYQRRDFTWLREQVDRVVVYDGHLDDRRQRLATANRDRCLRPFNELIIDHYGNGHLCCMDWRGRHRLGNVHEAGFRSVVERYVDARHKAAQQPMTYDAPAVCSRCVGRQNQIADLVPTVQAVTNRDTPWENGS